MSFSSTILNAKAYDFTPQKDLADKSNFSRHVFIERDGQINEVIRLNVLDDRHREEIVGYHFSLQYAQTFYRNQADAPQLYIIGRDCPWDFEYILHDSTNFFLEITRIADTALLKAIKRENEARQILSKVVLKGYEVTKVEKAFPGTFSEELLKQADTKVGRKSEFPNNPASQQLKIFMRPTMWPQLVDLKLEIKSAIQNKINKPHDGKEKTILVLDNLTTHISAEAFYDAFAELEDFIQSTPFQSIWLYTGYYSDGNGQNSEFSLLPIKLSEGALNNLMST